MNKALKFSLLTVVLFIAGVLVFLQVIKPRVSSIIRDALDERLEATVTSGEADITLFRSFPRVAVSLNDIRVLRGDSAAVDTLGSIDRFSVSFDVLPLLRGRLEVHSMRADRPVVNVVKDEAGNINWDMFRDSGRDGDSSASESGFSIRLRDVSFSDAHLVYRDEALDTRVEMNGWDHRLRGDFSAGQSVLATSNNADSVRVVVGGVTWLDDVSVGFDADIEADLAEKVFGFRKNRLRINELGIVFDGRFEDAGEGMQVDMTFAAEDVVLRDLLSLVPALYAQGFGSIEADGAVSLNGVLNGVWTESAIPSLNLDVDVTDGSFGYRDRNVPVDRIELHGTVSNPGGHPDSTVISFPEISLQLDGRPLEAGVDVKRPFSDFFLDGSLSGRVLLEDVVELYPVEGLELAGDMRMDLRVRAPLQELLEGRGNAILADGVVDVSDVRLASGQFRPSISVNQARVRLSPSAIVLESSDVVAGKSDFSLKGRLTGYSGYLFGDRDLEGSFSLASGTLVLDEFENLEEEKGPLLLPSRVSIAMDAVVGRAVLNDMEFRDVRGGVSLKDEKISLTGMTASTLGGKVNLKGYYSSKGGTPETWFSADASEVNVVTSYQSVPLLQKVAPVAEYSRGDVSAELDMNMMLDDAFQPVLETLTGKGSVSTTGLKVENFPPLNRLGLLLDMTLLDTIDIADVSIDFAVDDGRVSTPPFSFSLNDIEVNASGVTGFDRSLDWKLEMKVPRRYIGPAGRTMLSGLLQKLPLKGLGASLPDTLMIDAAIGGTVSEPKIGLDVEKTASRMIEQAAKGIGERFTGALGARGDSSAVGKDSSDVSPGIFDVLKGVVAPGQERDSSEASPDSTGQDTSRDQVIPGVLKNLFK
ncbi:AsmA family protein [Prosthecochloris sp. N3]|uniref:AsmA family protein n=1 Tax=Prosthecochloris ethylica TaxID=2743976 RepID=A0ABR9XP91_9CHLB|nr:AsmA-like C-terminal region-containing protein [Prosthecochloris ethylica]MBF0586145.1 AsmA family protein [Prosthecochloris ethylica]MBF0635851.1 AsmA family protein [Prosthecochloris ethylica]NUK47474.1 AsmA family protein [Prosthecochloris ethylica]